jgi:hypothetical protein
MPQQGKEKISPITKTNFMQQESGKMHSKFRQQTIIFGIVISVFALIIAGLGIWLVYLKSVGQTHFQLFGQEFQSDNVGIAAIFIGAVVLIIGLRRTFKSLDSLTDSYKKTTSDILSSKRDDIIPLQ